MKPYPNHNIQLDQQIFNYRLSRARRIIENTFGIATTRFQIFRRPIIAKQEKFILVTKAVVALHNNLMRNAQMQVIITITATIHHHILTKGQGLE